MLKDPLVHVVARVEIQVLGLEPSGQVLVGGGQGLDFLGLRQIGDSKVGSLGPDSSDGLSQEAKFRGYRGLQLSKNIFRIIVIIGIRIFQGQCG